MTEEARQEFARIHDRLYSTLSDLVPDAENLIAELESFIVALIRLEQSK